MVDEKFVSFSQYLTYFRCCYKSGTIVFSTPSYKPSFNFLTWLLWKLAYLNMPSILELACTALHACSRINDMLEKADLVKTAKNAIKVKLASYEKIEN